VAFNGLYDGQGGSIPPEPQGLCEVVPTHGDTLLTMVKGKGSRGSG
jgi:hypothetical protein